MKIQQLAALVLSCGLSVNLFAEDSKATKAKQITKPASSDLEEAALKAAKGWLKLIDSRDYVKSFDEAATVFKKQIGMDAETWSESVGAVREPLGGVKSRVIKMKKHFTEAPALPDGDYVAIEFETLFENKKSPITETLTAMIDKQRENSWRIAGYFIR